MKFLLAPTSKAAQRARPPVRWFLAFAGLMLLGAFVQRALNGGLTPSGVQGYYLGDGEPLGQVALWEEVHVNAFLYGMLLLMVGSLLVVSPMSPRIRSALLWGTAIAALLDLFSPFLVVATGLGLLRVVSFVAVTAGLAASIAMAAARFGKRAPGGDE